MLKFVNKRKILIAGNKIYGFQVLTERGIFITVLLMIAGLQIRFLKRQKK